MIIRQRVLPNDKFGKNVGIWKGYVVYEILCFMFKAEANVGFITGLLVAVTVLSRRHRIRHRCGV